MCKRLFIFGNGFDIMHRKDEQLNTNYSNFRSWLISQCNNYNNDKIYDFSLPSYQTNYRRLESYDIAEFAEFFIRLIDDADDTICENDEWSHFEDTLALLNWGLILDEVEVEYDNEGDIDPWKTQNNYAITAQNASESNHILAEFFKNWILEVNSDFSKIPKNSFFERVKMNNQDFFLNFNYTSTLEKIYNILNVCHIHGDASKYEELIIGHREDNLNNFGNDLLKDEAYDFFKTIFYRYKKQPYKNIKKHEDFFKKLRNIKEIYVLGFSFGKADLDYFKYIFQITDAKKLYLHIFRDEEYEAKKRIVESLGFKGKIIDWKHY